MPYHLFWSKIFSPNQFGEGHGTPLQYSCLENPMDGGAWWAAVHGVTRSLPQLSNFTFTFHFHALEKEMATHSSILVWRIPRTGVPNGLPSMGLQSRTRLKRLSSSSSSSLEKRGIPHCRKQSMRDFCIGIEVSAVVQISAVDCQERKYRLNLYLEFTQQKR